MRDLVPIFVIGIITLGIYRLFELYARRQERLDIIEKLASNNEIKNVKLDLNMPFFGRTNLSWMWSLRAALLLMGVGLGLFVGFIIDMSISWDIETSFSGNAVHRIREILGIIYFACIGFFGGTGLLVSYLIENAKDKKFRQSQKED